MIVNRIIRQNILFSQLFPLICFLFTKIVMSNPHISRLNSNYAKLKIISSESLKSDFQLLKISNPMILHL